MQYTCNALVAIQWCQLCISTGMTPSMTHLRRHHFDAAAGFGAWTYYSSTTRFTYMFNNTPTTQQMAEFACQAAGGHLASYSTLQEQREVEQAFVASGRLMPAFHGSYWMGLRSVQAWHLHACAQNLKMQERWGGLPPRARQCRICIACVVPLTSECLTFHPRPQTAPHTSRGTARVSTAPDMPNVCRANDSMDFGWVDATAGPLSPYRPWGHGQPVSTVPPWLCGGVNMSQLLSFAGTWMNAPCTRSMPFMCRWVQATQQPA
jgi:hypothetical protein